MSYQEVDADSLYDILFDSAMEAMDVVEGSMTLAEKTGPSIWKDMHYRAKVADSEGRFDLYNAYIHNLAQTLPCVECRGHLQKNLQLHPPSKYRSAFLHSVVLHNTVNSVLGKPTMSYQDAYSLYNIDCESCSFRRGRKDSSTDETNQETNYRVRTRTKDRPEVHQYTGSHSYDRRIRGTISRRGDDGHSVL